MATKKKTTKRKSKRQGRRNPAPPAAAKPRSQMVELNGQQIGTGLMAVLEVVNGCDERRERQLRDDVSRGVRILQLILNGQITLGQGGKPQPVEAPPAEGATP